MADGFNLDFDIEGFREWTELAIKEVERDAAEKVLRALALDFVRRVIEKTPVDFGRARAGWASFAVKMGRSPRIGRGASGGIKQSGKGVGKETTAEQAKGLAEGSFKESFRGSDQFIEIIDDNAVGTFCRDPADSLKPVHQIFRCEMKIRNFHLQVSYPFGDPDIDLFDELSIIAGTQKQATFGSPLKKTHNLIEFIIGI